MEHDDPMSPPRRHFLIRYGIAVLAAAAALAPMRIPGVGISATSLCYLAIFVGAGYGGLGPGLLATALPLALGISLRWREPVPVTLPVVLSFGLFAAGGVLISLVVPAIVRARRLAEAAAADAARQSERLRTTLRSIGDAVIVADEGGRVVSLNPVAEALTGWPEEAAAGRPLAEVFRVVEGEGVGVSGGDSAERILRAWGLGGLSGRSSLVARDGSSRPIDETAATIRDDEGKVRGAVLVFRDVTRRRDTERRLAAAEARFRAFMDHSPVVAYIKDEDGRYLWGNAAWGRLHAGGLASALGKTDDELWPPATALRFREGDRAALASGGATQVDEPSTDRDGSSHHWLSLKFRIGDDERPLIGGISVDATERIAQERALRESEARYRALFESNPLPMWVYEVDSLRFLAVNEAAVRTYGYTADEFLAMRITDIRPIEDVPALLARVGVVRNAGQSEETTWRHRRKDGSILDVEISSHAFTFEGRAARLVLAHDITARRRAEEGLRINRERLDLVLKAVELGVWYGDVPSGGFTLDERARSHHGLAPGEAVTLDGVLARIHPDDRAAVRGAVERAMAEAADYDATYRISAADGPPRWVRAIGRSFADASGRVARFDGITIDVTRQQEAEARLREATGAAVEANRAKDRFLAVLGHELRTPLTPILAAVSSLLDAPPRGPAPLWTDEQVAETFAMIRRNVELETRLINDVLDVARVQRGQLRLQIETVDLHRVLREAVDICRDEILVSGLDVRLALGAPDHFVEADPARVLQIAWNLIHNAAKFSPPGARLTIRTANPPRAGDDLPTIVAEFEDSGVGMGPDVLARVFEPFEQGDSPARRRIGGLGLGLAIGRSIAEAHGGRLTATSPGRGLGSTFRLELKTTARPEPMVPDTRDLDGSAAAPSRSVLLVEDNRDTARYLAALLGHRGYRVSTASGIAEAAEAASGAPFDVMISDIELPDGSGLDLMRRLRGKLVGVAVSGFGSESDVQLSLEAGFSAHLTKPLDFARLEATIRDALDVGTP